MSQETLVLRPRMRKTVILCLASGLFFTGGVWMVQDGEPKGWFVAIFFGAALLISLLLLVPGANSLTLTASGFIVKSLFRSHFVAWEDIRSFQPGVLAGHETVFFNFNAQHRQHRNAKQLSRWLSGSEAALPDTYGLTAEALLETLEAWRMKEPSLDGNRTADQC